MEMNLDNNYVKKCQLYLELFFSIAAKWNRNLFRRLWMSPAKLIILRPFLRVVLIWTIVWAANWSSASDKLTPTSDAFRPDNDFFVVGHRGAAGLAPENTLAALKWACELSVGAVELDVYLSADSHIVVHHDYQLKPETTRSSNGDFLNRPGPAIRELTLTQLKSYDVGRLKPNTRYSRRYPEQQPVDGERIPTLRESMAFLNANCDDATQLWIEIKTNPEKPGRTPSPEMIAGAVVKVVGKQNYTARVRILAFDWRVLDHVQKIAPAIPLVYLTHVGDRLNTIKPGRAGASPWMAGLDIDDFNGSIPRTVKAAGGKHWAPHYSYLTLARLKEAHQLGLKVYVWTVDSRIEMIRLIEMGVDGIITNRPDILNSVVGLGR
jgi:glycerophosphoryl diester phosphodiesterase